MFLAALRVGKLSAQSSLQDDVYVFGKPTLVQPIDEENSGTDRTLVVRCATSLTSWKASAVYANKRLAPAICINAGVAMPASVSAISVLLSSYQPSSCTRLTVPKVTLS